MINLPDYFRAETASSVVDIFPIIVIGPERSQFPENSNNHISKYFFASTKSKTIAYTGKESNNKTIFVDEAPPIDIKFQPVLKSISGCE